MKTRSLFIATVVLAGTLSACSSGSNGAAAGTSSATTPSATTATPTTTTAPAKPRVSFLCTSPTRIEIVLDVGGDFTKLWSQNPAGCQAYRLPSDLTAIEQQAVAAADVKDDGINTLYGFCGSVDPENTYVSDGFSPTPDQIKEISGVLILCPHHPLATNYKQAIVRGQADAAAKANGELFDDGTYRVGQEVKPGTYAIEGVISGCYWERTDANGNPIDNNFINSAKRVQVTIRSSDYGFHSERCGEWRKVH